MHWKNRLGRWLHVGCIWSACALTFGAAGAGCLARPVGKQPPTTKVNFTQTLQQQSVTKVDILFAIDNSQSMGDKQSILAKAVPDLIRGLVQPACIDGTGKKLAGKFADPNGNGDNRYGCPDGSEPEFKPITDMHLGVVSSSLGNFGGDVCPPPSAEKRTNDRGRLLNVKKGGGRVEAASRSNFLAWFPENKENENADLHPPPEKPVRTLDGPTGLEESFKSLVVGVEQNGCGLEAQLESVYHFLIAPDPWEEVIRNPNNDKAELRGIDTELLRQRADFLRPDSLVAVIMLTDEDDSSADPLANDGQGWSFMANRFPGSAVSRPDAEGGGTTAPRGTSACETTPGAKDALGDLCNSCGIACDPAQPLCQRIKQDPNCKASPIEGKSGKGVDGFYGPLDDNLNVRFHRMKQRFGVDPQYPLQRYIDGFTSPKIPDTKAEHVVTSAGVAGYTGTKKCTNPLFAESLPRGEPNDELCNRPLSKTRSPDRVFLALVGGVPHQLLHFDAESQERSEITEADWIKIVGKDPANFNYEGIDPHMVQSVEPRSSLGLGGEDKALGDNGTDPIHGREWKTAKRDLQYACTFDLPESDVRDCVEDDVSCDCQSSDTRNPPLCKGTKQIKAKDYPTIRQLRVVRSLGAQGIVSSLCPIQLKDESAPTFGYRPAVSAIINRLKKALTSTCLPQRLRDSQDDAQEVPCLVLAQLSTPTEACSAFGLEPPEANILKVFREDQRTESGATVDGGVNLAELPVCVIPQQAVNRGETCKNASSPRWCYVENDLERKQSPAGQCAQAILFSRSTDQLTNARYNLVCIRQFSADALP